MLNQENKDNGFSNQINFLLIQITNSLQSELALSWWWAMWFYTFSFLTLTIIFGKQTIECKLVFIVQWFFKTTVPNGCIYENLKQSLSLNHLVGEEILSYFDYFQMSKERILFYFVFIGMKPNYIICYNVIGMLSGSHFEWFEIFPCTTWYEYPFELELKFLGSRVHTLLSFGNINTKLNP